MRTMKISKTKVMLSLISVLSLNACINAEKSSTPDKKAATSTTVFFEQGWSRDEALDFYNTTQGSNLLPYAWFLALEQHDNQMLFRDNENIKKLGYIPQQKTPGDNPDGLPIGFVRDNLKDPLLSSGLVKARLSPDADDNNMGNSEWLGLTCAACHLSLIHI